MITVAATTAAIVVVYRNLGPVRTTLATLRALMPCVLLVDNAERPHEGLEALALGLRVGYLHGGNVGGLAGAYNRALDRLTIERPELQQVVFLDEDSDVGALAAFMADPATVAALADPVTAAVSPAYRDRATALRGRYMRLERWRIGYHPREFAGLRDVAFLINSMSVWRREALVRIGAFDQALALDHIDTEYCLRARALGPKLRVHGDHEFAHAIGERVRYRFFGMEVQAGGHPPARRYLIGRNTVWLARRWLWREPAFALLCAARLGYEAVGIAAAEPRAAGKLWALMRGMVRGLCWPMRPAATRPTV